MYISVIAAFHRYFRIVGMLVIFTVGSWSTFAQTNPVNSANSTNNASEKTLALRLIAVKTDDERILLVKDASSIDKNVLAKEILDESDRQKGKVPNAEIERIARVGLHFAEVVGNKREIGRAWHAIGTAQTGNADKLASYNKGLDAANEVSANDLAVKIIISIGQMQDTKEKEIDWYLKGIAYAERHPDKKVLSGLYGRIGNAYTQKGDYTTAREYHARSLEIKQKMNDIDGISISLSNLGIVNTIQGDLTAALQNLKESIAISESLDIKEGLAIDSFNLGNVYMMMGDYAQAMTQYLRSLRISDDIKSGHGAFGALFNIANIYNLQGSYELARQSLRRAANVSNDEQLPEITLGVLGDSYLGEGRYDEAIKAYLRRLEDKKKTGNKDDMAETLINIGDCYLLKEDPNQAELYFNQAITFGRQSQNGIPVFNSLIGTAKSKLIRKDFAAALDFSEQAISQYEKLNGVQDRWDLYSTIGRAYAGLEKPGFAGANFEKAVAIVENSRKKTAGGLAEQKDFLSNKVTPFQLMVETLVSTNSVDAALSFAERAKARTLVDTLGHGKINIAGAMSPGERKAEQNLKNDLVSLNAQIENEKGSKAPAPNRINELEKQLADKRIEFSAFQYKTYTDHPELKIQRGEMKPISLEEVAALLPDAKSAVAEFVVAEDKTFLFVITKDAAKKTSLKAFRVDVKNKELGKRVEAYRSKVAGGDLDFQKESRELYDLLLKPAQAQLAGKTNLIIVPDGPLWDLPFQALQDGKGRYLVEQAAVSYAPSLTALKEMSKKAKARKPDAGLELLAFGNPIVGKATSDRIKQVFMSEKLEPLPESERLVNELGKMYGANRSRVFVGDHAREETAKTESPKYRIVQFATHGILNNVSPMYSHLVLAQNEKNPNEDGLLEAWEMKDLDLKADMVILSACDTARGKISNGEGVIGMSWAMFIAGTPTTVASQWKVESSSTTELMLEFHRQLLSGKGISKAAALRRAELKLMKMPQYKHPSYWAGFVIVGDGS